MRRFLPSLSALQAFDAAARHMSFTRAAEDLHLTQSGISRQINSLESYLGVRLFQRIGSRLVLTEIGRTYAAEVQAALDGLEEISIDAVRGRKLTAALRIGVETTVAARWLLTRLPKIFTTPSDLAVEIIEISGVDQFTDMGLDAGVLRGRGSWSGLRSYELFPEELVVVAAPSLAQTLDLTGAIDFSTLPTLQNASRPNQWLNWLRLSKRDYSGTIQGLRLATTGLTILAAEQGLGLALVPKALVKCELEAGSLITCLAPTIATGESYWLVVSDEKADLQGLRQLRDWLIPPRST